MPSNIGGHTLSWEELSQDSPSNIQKLPTDNYIIEKYGISTKQCTKYDICKNMKKGHLSKITFSCQLSKTFKNLEAKHHKDHLLTLR